VVAVLNVVLGAWELGEGAVRTVVQPVVRLDDGVVIGYEALARVSSPVPHPPDWWLARAEEAGVRTEVEVAFLESAARLGPPPGDGLLFVNASPVALAEPALVALRSRLPERLVIEITEQAAVDDYALLKEQLEPWIGSRARVAIDDTGAGYSSLRHVVELSPDFLKLDRTLVHDIDKDRNRHALVRAMVAFAREVGTSVIAEGVETPGELAALRAAEVPLAQGYLLGRPGLAWPESTALARPGRTDRDRDAGLRAALAGARDVEAACDAVVAHLFRQGQVMPSLYLERNGQLRCVAQRGLWQVLDGLPADAGITGRVWATAKPIVVDEVASSADYLEAVPGVVAEICVPVTVDGSTAGALNVDSLCPFPAGALRSLQDCAALLSRRLGAIGWRPEQSSWQRAGQGSVAISGLAVDRDAPARILAAMLAASGLDSAGLVLVDGRAPEVAPAIGPLAPALRQVRSDHLVALCSLVDRLSSCYTGRETTGLAYPGSETLRVGGARAVILLPLRANNIRLGTIILAHSRPMHLAADDVEPLELLAGQAAAVLNAVALVERLRRQAHHDGLTGLRNREAFDQALDHVPGWRTAVLIADVDHFKRVNDRLGHLEGDEALRAVARELSVGLPGLSFYRFGGDELTCLLPDAEGDGAGRTAEAVCAIGRRVLRRWDTSLSVGVAVSSPGETPRETFARADTALLWAKRHARGHASVAPLGQRPPASARSTPPVT
jgi:diguanylate cyclase (GGDEF)-like protein